ncbi:MAG: hypothetical protein WCG80_05355 [Spirochaetales bacterium]
MSATIWFLLGIVALIGGVVTTIVRGIRKGKDLPPPDPAKLRPWNDEK